jgi:NAD(P)-dependent dehydrogenase (short-subunit alcohol dehydrogenase family)
MIFRRDYRGKVVLVTGAGGGLGRTICASFGREGAKLGLLDLPGEGLKRIGSELTSRGMECSAAECDVTDEGQCIEAVAKISQDLGGVDVLVNNAGITQRSGFESTRTEVFRKVMDVNFFGSLHCTRAALDDLKRARGQIVVISSVAGLAPLLGRTGYSASKHALRGLFGSLRAELRTSKVGVLMVYPSFVDTGLEKRAFGGDGQVTGHPQSRVGGQLTAGAAADAIVRAAARNRRTLVLGWVGHATRMIHAHNPALYEAIMARALKSELDGQEDDR